MDYEQDSDDTGLAALADAYAGFLVIRRNAETILIDEQKKLRDLYMNAIVPGGSGSSNLPLDDVDDDQTRALLRDAEHVAVRGVPVGTVATSRTSEREIRDYESSIRQQRRRFEQIRRMRQRGALGRRPRPAKPRTLELMLIEGGDVICALCDRDSWAPPGHELVLAPADSPEPAVVCWICADEHAPELTAEALARAVLSVEQQVAGTADYRDHWVSLLRRMGLQQHAIDLEGALDNAKSTVREMKAAALGIAETWFKPL